jgi:hypothetical protein
MPQTRSVTKKLLNSVKFRFFKVHFEKPCLRPLTIKKLFAVASLKMSTSFKKN